MDLSAPPLPPSVTAQQSPLTRFSQTAGGGNPATTNGASTQQGNAMELVGAMLSEVGQKLTDIAKILVNEKPQLVAILKPAVQALAMLQNETQQGNASQGGAGGGPQQVNPGQGMAQTPQGQAAGVSAG